MTKMLFPALLLQLMKTVFLVVTYNDGSILTQFIDEAETVQWKYITPEGVTITGDDVLRESTSLREDANFVIELATMVNPEGLVSLNNNLWEWGPDVGDIFLWCCR